MQALSLGEFARTQHWNVVALRIEHERLPVDLVWAGVNLFEDTAFFVATAIQRGEEGTVGWRGGRRNRSAKTLLLTQDGKQKKGKGWELPLSAESWRR